MRRPVRHPAARAARIEAGRRADSRCWRSSCSAQAWRRSRRGRGTGWFARRADALSQRTGRAHPPAGAGFRWTRGVTLQEAANDCGAAALKMIFDRAGRVRPLQGLATRGHRRAGGSTMLRLWRKRRARMASRRGLADRRAGIYPGFRCPPSRCCTERTMSCWSGSIARPARSSTPIPLGRIRSTAKRFHPHIAGDRCCFPRADAARFDPKGKEPRRPKRHETSNNGETTR